MIDGLYGARMNRAWEFLARGLARTGISPNAVTIAGLVLVLAGCGAYAVHRDSLIFAAWLAAAFAFDGLDGALARLTNRSSRCGAYLDAVIDRYQELAVLGTLAWVHDLWAPAFLVVTGSLLTSYHKARAAMEIAVRNDDWPDLLERLERIVALVALIALDGLLPSIPGMQMGTLAAGLIALGVLTHLTALQRFARARRRIASAEDSSKLPENA